LRCVDILEIIGTIYFHGKEITIIGYCDFRNSLEWFVGATEGQQFCIQLFPVGYMVLFSFRVSTVLHFCARTSCRLFAGWCIRDHSSHHSNTLQLLKQHRLGRSHKVLNGLKSLEIALLHETFTLVSWRGVRWLSPDLGRYVCRRFVCRLILTPKLAFWRFSAYTTGRRWSRQLQEKAAMA
jgi:hypothetical protein